MFLKNRSLASADRVLMFLVFKKI